MIMMCALLAAACSGANQIQPFEDAAGLDGEVALGPTVPERAADEVAADATAGDATAGDATAGDEARAESPTTTQPDDTVRQLPTIPVPPAPVVVLGAGNLGGCNDHSIEVLAAIAALSDPVIAAGDLSADGSAASLKSCFVDPFGDDLDRLLAVPGDRDLATADGAAFYELVGQTSVETAACEGWFVTTLGAWQVIGLNSRCEDVGGCGPESAQFQWLHQVLLEQPAECRIAVFHDSRFTSTIRRSDPADLGAIVGRLDGAGTDIIVSGSSGNYERLGPIRPSGRPPADDQTGMMHFNVGSTAGVDFGEVRHPGSAVREGDVAGYLRLTLAAEGYSWEFVGVSNDEPLVFDAGSADC